MAGMVMSCEKKADHGEGVVLKGIDGLSTCGGRACYSARIRTRSLCHVQTHHPLNVLFNVTHPYTIKANAG